MARADSQTACSDHTTDEEKERAGPIWWRNNDPQSAGVPKLARLARLPSSTATTTLTIQQPTATLSSHNAHRTLPTFALYILSVTCLYPLYNLSVYILSIISCPLSLLQPYIPTTRLSSHTTQCFQLSLSVYPLHNLSVYNPLLSLALFFSLILHLSSLFRFL